MSGGGAGGMAPGDPIPDRGGPRAAVESAMARGQVVDITTTGRRSGQPRRIEIVTHVVDGRLFISGMPSPRTRAWIQNLGADPRLTLHLKREVHADLPAHARIITDEAERRAILPPIARAWRRELEPMVRQSPLIEVTLDAGASEGVAAEGVAPDASVA
jgi:deazaflavin-dependent oxidoreductase (nitroreductase family)